jgi:hypothetical protein
MPQMSNNGYLYVASVNKSYYYAAKKSAESLLDFYPEAKITLATHEFWVEEEDYEIFDTIITEDVPENIRAKLWALSKTPYDRTLYIDADTVIESEDIANVFDFCDDHDIIFTRNRPYNAKITKLSDTEEMIWHCGLFVYKNNKHIFNLMDAWYEQYMKQLEPDWTSDPYPWEVRRWDTFSMWYLLNKTEHKDIINVGEFPKPDARWNFVIGYLDAELEDTERVIFHYTIPNSELTRNEDIRRN